MDRSTLHKFQHQFWVTKQTVFRKLGKKEDECIVSSDASLDAKLELFKSIQQTSTMMNKLLDRYQERICYLAQEQNSMGRFLKEYGKSDKSGAGKMMIQMGKSLVYCSQQEIGLRQPLLRLYQEVETFRNRAVEDTFDTVRSMEKHRTDYRASLNWMKNVSQELDPDTYRQMEKFRKVQNHVKKSKSQFDKYKLAVLQKVDLLAAARCNMFSHALIQYQNAIMKQTEKNARIFNTLANTFRGYQHFEFTFIKDLAEPSKQLAEKHGSSMSNEDREQGTDELIFDLENTESQKSTLPPATDEQPDEDMLNIGDYKPSEANKPIMTAQDLLSSELLLENLLGGPFDQSPETEQASDALDMTLAWPSTGTTSSSTMKPEKDVKDSSSKEKSSVDYLTEELESCFEGETNDTMALLNELLQSTTSLTSSNTVSQGKPDSQIPTAQGGASSSTIDLLSSINIGNTPTAAGTSPAGFLPSQLLLDLANSNSTANGKISDPMNFDFSNLGGTGMPILTPIKGGPSSADKEKPKKGTSNQQPSWYDIFSDIDPISNPDALTKRQEGTDDSC